MQRPARNSRSFGGSSRAAGCVAGSYSPGARQEFADISANVICRLRHNVEGCTVNSNLVIERDRPGHEFVRQYWTQADGTGRRWLAVQHEYTRAGTP
ncbi:MAG TPA: hypothetical protein VFX37_08420 [Pseudolabrys sp.]|nr:hypothetical protein [Pseudolabrys sp.]